MARKPDEKAADKSTESNQHERTSLGDGPLNILTEASNEGDLQKALNIIGEYSAYIIYRLTSDPSPEELRKWVRFSAAAVQFSEEGIVDVVQNLWELYPEETL